jgi:cytochrome b561
MNENARTRYSPLAMLLHWAIAILVIINWRAAEAAEHASKADGEKIMGNHFAFGVIILVLAIAHLIVRFTSPRPPLARHLKPWEAVLAKVTHALLGLLVILLPLMGWTAMSFYGQSISVFGAFSLPPLPLSPDKDMAKAIFEAHGVVGAILVYLMFLHIAGTLKHTLLDRDGNLFRMLPFGTPKA